MPTLKTLPTGIAAWPQDERPRERLLSKGAQALTDAELVAILIRVGFKGTNAVEMARQLLKQFGSLRAMVEAPVIALLDVKGLKGAKAAQLIAATEIARRVSVSAARGQLVMKSTAAAAAYLRDRLHGLAEEQFRVLYQFNMISPKSYNVFFQKLRDGGVIGFRSDLDVAMTKAVRAGS